jgi:hypothetical protein
MKTAAERREAQRKCYAAHREARCASNRKCYAAHREARCSYWRQCYASPKQQAARRAGLAKVRRENKRQREQAIRARIAARPTYRAARRERREQLEAIAAIQAALR